MNEVKWRYFKISGKIQGQPKKVGIRAITEPSMAETIEMCKDMLDEVEKIEETTEDLLCYCAI